MADLVRVEFVNGNEGAVGRDWLSRWPEDIKRVLDPIDPAPVGEETNVAPATPTPTTGKKKEK